MTRFSAYAMLGGVFLAVALFVGSDWHNLRDRLIRSVSLAVNLEDRELAREKYLHRLDLFSRHTSDEKKGPVFLGDSLTSFYELEAFFPTADAVNRGIAGDTTTGILRRLDRSFSDWRGRSIFLMIGYNDLKYRRPEDVLMNIEKIVGSLVEKGVRPERIVLQSVLPVDKRRAWVNAEIRTINLGLQRLAKDAGCGYLDLHGSFLGDGGGVRDELVVDGVHLSRQGYELWTRLILDRYPGGLEVKGGAQ